jgi:tRNA (guanine-N7-)-methyltransferase
LEIDVPSGRVFVEIGFGNGEFLGVPGKDISGCSYRRYRGITVVCGKGSKTGPFGRPDNVRIMHGDARFLLRNCFAPESAERVFMNFPCPWPKTEACFEEGHSPGFADLMAY